MFKDLVDFFGPAGAPAAAAVATYAIFSATDGLASDEAKKAIAARLRRLDVTATPKISQIVAGIFNRFFGPKHFTLICLYRSVVVSLWAIVIIGCIWALLDLDRFREWRFSFHDMQDPYVSLAIRNDYVKWTLASLPVDYILLLKTRFSLVFLSRRPLYSRGLAYLFPFFDLILGLCIFRLIGELTHISEFGVRASGAQFSPFTTDLFDPLKFDTLPSILFFAGMVPSLWLWLFLLSETVTSTLLRSATIISGFRWFFELDKTPIKSIGFIASVLTFVLVSFIAGLIHLAQYFPNVDN